MPKGRVEPREVICKACAEPFVSDRAGRAAFFCHRTECDEERERARKARHAAEKATRAAQRQQDRQRRRIRLDHERAAAREEKERARKARVVAEREERERQRRVQRATEVRQRAIEVKLRKKGLEIFAPIMDDPDQMKMVMDILEIVQLASGLTDPSWVELRKAITAVAHAKPEGREKSHVALKRLSAVAMRMADTMRTHTTREPKIETEEPDRELVAA